MKHISKVKGIIALIVFLIALAICTYVFIKNIPFLACVSPSYTIFELILLLLVMFGVTVLLIDFLDLIDGIVCYFDKKSIECKNKKLNKKKKD